LSDGEIANKLNLTELKVQSCIAWMLQFLKFTDRKELVHYASPAVVGMGTA
jgi:DNA-binding NarL/FixJ family response regulator